MKLVYVHEGYEKYPGKSTRKKLKNCHYFSGIYQDSQRLWEEVYSYLDDSYNLKSVEKIYFSGDGAKWIKEGMRYLPKTIFVLDRFHVIKYVKKACIGMLSCTAILLDWFDQNQKKYVKAFFKSRLEDGTLSENQRKNILNAQSYLLGNWAAIQKQHNEDYIGCSAEGHVSHVLSSRLSSRPLGWSKTGANNIAKLRVFLKNQGKLLIYLENENKKFQKKTRIKRLDRRVIGPKKEFNQQFLVKFPLLENGLITGARNRIVSVMQ